MLKTILILLIFSSQVFSMNIEQSLIQSLKQPHPTQSCDHNFGVTLPADLKWKKKEVKVCWAKPSQKNQICRGEKDIPLIEAEPANAAEIKSKTKAIIEKEYTLEKTGIHYVGWKECDPQAPADVMLFVTSFDSPLVDGVIGEASIGPCAVFNGVEQKHLSPYLIIGPSNGKTYPGLSHEDDFSFVLLHEFGHLSGLYHEQLNFPQYVEMNNNRFGVPAIIPTSTQDESSIMHYEFNFLLMKKGVKFIQDKTDEKALKKQNNIVKIKPLNDKQEEVSITIGLSDGDINALKCLYVYSEKEKKTKCSSKRPPTL